MFQFLLIIAHGLILSNSLSEYTYNLSRICGVYILLMSCIGEQMRHINQSRFLIDIYGNALTPHFSVKFKYPTTPYSRYSSCDRP